MSSSVRLKNIFNCNRQLKICLLLIISFCCQITFGQSNISAKWNRPDLLSIDTTWKYKSGTPQPNWFTPGFNDQQWQTISNNYLNGLSPASANWNQVGVF